ncbi:hypothetical protein HIM_11260 [Hirsutella minnesotensis 3608]|uniref:Uncharacterized protein n=1 Tax=Hirsutella minnesotensis 3608 TaxID=1043627 RepID=A0A0F8A1E5_9HYPO|nr:hypothetical protein HIM_11260 [Hirsutella minnesotensis 3608]
MSLTSGKNPFPNVGKWTPELLNRIQVEIDDVKETTSPFTRSKNPGNRYWKAYVHFKFEKFESKIIKMTDCDVPHIKASNYGTDFIIARLQKSVGDKIVAEALKKDIVVSLDDKRVPSDENNWWLTINNTSGRIGTINPRGEFDPKDLGAIFKATEEGVKLNLDLVFSLKLTLENKRDRSNVDKFSLVADCSRGAIRAIRQAVEAPSIDTAIPQQKASKDDVASQELVDEIDKLML